MGARDERSGGLSARVLDADEVQGVLSGAFYTPRPGRGAADGSVPTPPSSRPSAADKPTHYKVICISMYTRDLTKMDALVEALKARGVTKASRSALIRAALDQVDLDKIPRGM